MAMTLVTLTVLIYATVISIISQWHYFYSLDNSDCQKLDAQGHKESGHLQHSNGSHYTLVISCMNRTR